MNIYELDADTAHDVWDSLRGWLAEAMSYHPVMDVVDLYHVCMSGRAQVVVVIDEGRVRGAAVIEVVEFPSNRVSNVIALGGERGFLDRYLAPVVRHLTGWSQRRGCDTMMAHGRSGWARALKRFGAFPAAQTVTCVMPLGVQQIQH